MAEILSYPQLLLLLWLEGAEIRLLGPDELGIRAATDLAPEIAEGIRHYKPELMKLARKEPGPLRLPAKLYFSMFWAPKPEWRYPYTN